MKKISIISMLVLLTVPAIATDLTNDLNEQNITNAVAQNVVKNSKAKFPHGLQFGVGVSPTSGLNGFIGYNNKKLDSFWWKRFGVRFDFASYSPIKKDLNRKINDSIGDEGIKIDDSLHVENVALNAKHYGAMVDFYPFGDTWFLGGWRLSGGYMIGNLDFDAHILGHEVDGKIEFELNHHKYHYADAERRGGASLDWKYNGPYIGTGFDLGLLWGFKIYMDAGVVFANKSAQIDLDVSTDGLYDANDNLITGDAALLATFNADRDAALDEARREVDKYPYYPLVKIGFMYRF